MSDRIEWVDAARRNEPRVVDHDISDGFGNTLSPGTTGIAIGPVTVLEGSIDELRTYARQLLRVIEQAASGTPATVNACTIAARREQLDADGEVHAAGCDDYVDLLDEAVVAVGQLEAERAALQAAIEDVHAQLDAWEQLSKGETPTTAAIRRRLPTRSTP